MTLTLKQLIKDWIDHSNGKTISRDWLDEYHRTQGNRIEHHSAPWTFPIHRHRKHTQETS